MTTTTYTPFNNWTTADLEREAYRTQNQLALELINRLDAVAEIRPAKHAPHVTENTGRFCE